MFPLRQAQGNGALKEMVGLAEQCMADYDENDWHHPAYRDGADVSVLGRSERRQGPHAGAASAAKAEQAEIFPDHGGAG